MLEPLVFLILEWSDVEFLLQKIHIAGLKGGQRIKIIEADLPAEAEGPERAKRVEGKKAPRIRGRKYNEAKTKVDRNKSYPVKEAIKLVKETSYSKFDGSVELHMVIKKIGL